MLPKIQEAKLRTIKDFSSPWEEELFNYTRSPKPKDSNKKFTLIFPATDQAPTLRREFLLYTPCEGVSYICTVAAVMGWDVKLIDLRMDGTIDQAAAEAAERGGVLAMPTFVDSVPQNIEVLALARRYNNDLQIVIGGALVSSLPDSICRALEVDYAILQEGEVTLVELLQHIEAGKQKNDAAKIHGLAIKQDTGEIIQTLPRPQVKTLDSVPIPDLSLYPSIAEHPFIPEMGLTTARGCYGRCTFCFVNIPKMRFKSIERTEEELKNLVEKHRTNYLYINDLTFTADMNRTFHLCEVLAKYGIEWSCSTRVEKTDPKLLKKMKESGCREIWYGVESLDQNILDITQKRQTVAQIQDAIQMTLDSGIFVMANLIVGLPGETEGSLKKMLDFVENSAVIPASIKYLTPFPGTPIYEQAKHKGIVKDDVDYLIGLADRKVNNINDQIFNLTELPDERLRDTFDLITKIKNRRFKELMMKEKNIEGKLLRTNKETNIESAPTC